MSNASDYRVLIVDDEPTTATLVSTNLAKVGFKVESCHSLAAMKEALSTYSFDAILLDLHLDKESGIDGLRHILSEDPFARVFILSGNTSVKLAVEAMQEGASGYFTKDDKLADVGARVLEHLSKRHPDADGEFEPKDFFQLGLIGQGKKYRELCDTIEQIKDVDSTVLILGESGTGKEIVARSLHRLSKRSKGRFAAINCAAIPEQLLESELFGHVKGAFTDAKSDRKGIFETCSDGTLLLDEIGDMPLSLQSKLLRVLQERKIVPVGGSQPVEIGTRVIAATHNDLLEEIDNGRFREDLYFRLSVVPIMVPPLRHRKGDLELLIEHFLKIFNKRFSKAIQMPNQQLMNRLRNYDWPGNIRELKNSL